jgi:septum site-determining protein MinD
LSKALVKDKRVPGNLFLLPTSQTKFKEDIPEEAFVNIVREARDKMGFDFILIDSPAGIEYGFRLAARPAEEAIIVTIPEITAIRDADRVIGLLDNYGIEKRSLVVNRVDVAEVKEGNVLSPQDISDELSVKLLGIIPMDKVVTEATNEGKPVIVLEKERGKKTLAGKGFMSTAERIIDENAPLWDPVEEYVPSSGGLLGFFKNLLGGSGR